MILLAGLGNPGEKYAGNRHNAGFMFAEAFADHLIRLGGTWQQPMGFDSKRRAAYGKIIYKNMEYLILEPQTYMNASGEAVQRFMAFYKIPPDNLYVAHDDLDIPLGKFKIQKGTGPQLHNGIASIENKLGTKDFHRIRIGVENRGGEPISGETYVLRDFTEEERTLLPGIFLPIFSKIELL